jgi:hypothetical protein
MSLELRVVFFVGSRLRQRLQTEQASALLPPHVTPEGPYLGSRRGDRVKKKRYRLLSSADAV